MNTQNSKTNELHRFKLDITDKINLKNWNENMALANLSIYYSWKNIKSEYSKNKFKILAPTWNDTFDLPDGPYSISGIQDYFEFIIKKHETLTENPPLQIYPNRIKNRFFFFQNKDRLWIRTVNSWNNEIVRNYKKKTLTKIKMEKVYQN